MQHLKKIVLIYQFKSIDLHRELIDFGFAVDVVDPQADSAIFRNNTAKKNRKTISKLRFDYPCSSTRRI